MSENMKFEDAIERLEGEVKRLESGNMSLDEALTSYENAVRLAKICTERLEAAEAKVRILTESADGTVSDMPFVGTGDEA